MKHERQPCSEEIQAPHQNVAYENRGSTAWLTMNRPEVLNALSKEMFRELELGLRLASRDPLIHCIVIKGSGRAFSAGLDVKEVSRFSSKKEAREFVYELVKPFWERYFNCDKPVLSMVDGPAYGAGAEIALAADIVLASSRSTFAFSGGRVGALCCISAAFGHLTMTGRKAIEMNLTGSPLSAEEARSVGLVTHVEDFTRLEDLTMKILEEIRHVSPISNASFKRIRRSAMTSEAIKIAYRELLKTITSPDFEKGAVAFAQKEIPNYYT